MVKELTDIPIKIPFLPKDKNGREINIYKLQDSVLVGDSLYYPNVLIRDIFKGNTYNPLKEKIMSLEKLSKNLDDNRFKEDFVFTEDENCPVFFFLYNTDNYFHFVYDTLPYLISYIHLKKQIPSLKLLMNYPNLGKKEFYKFVLEFLEILDIKKSDIILAKKKILYSELYISNSYTHDIDSNLPPREEIYNFYKQIVSKINLNKPSPENIYISRRTWLHNDNSNIGTDYTTRRKLVNEDKLVEELTKKGYTEIFTEQLSTKEKLHLFSKAKNVVGAIGGGVVNALFCNENTKLKILISPTFLEKHERFKYSFVGKDTFYYDKSRHEIPGEWIKFMRVKSGDIVGEIQDIKDDMLLVRYTDHNVAGWNKEMILNLKWVPKKSCEKLDNGLNCAWVLDVENFIKTL